MKKIYFLSLLLCIGFGALSQPINIFSTGAAGSFTTATGTATTRTDGNIVSTATTSRGYAVIDLSAIPAAAVITSVTISFNVANYGGTPGAAGWNVRGFAGDLSTVTVPATLFADMGAAGLLTGATWMTGTGNRTLASTANSIAFIQANIGNIVSIIWAGGNTRIYTITGETGTATTTGAHAPFITVNWTIPPPCPAPTGVSATAVPNPACVGANLSLGGAATGATDFTWSGPGGYSATGLTQSAVVTASSGGVYTLTATNNCAGGTPTSTTATTVGISVLAAPAAITGSASICIGGNTGLADATGGGFWSTGAPGVATVDAGGVVTGLAGGTATISYTTPATGCSATLVVTVSAPTGAISGASTICIGNSTTLTDGSPGGNWTTSAPGTATVDAGGVVTGIAVGSATITYTVPGSACAPATFNITVTGLPVAITGPTTVCTGTTVTLSDFTGGGTWMSSNPSAATIDSVSGVVTGIAVGTANITYTITASGCFATSTMTVNLSPAPIDGPHTVCLGSTIILTDVSGPGFWSSNAPATATVDNTGAVTGLAIGVATISFSSSTTLFCPTTYSVTVNPIPVAIFGTLTVCTGSTTTLSDGTPGGTWSSSDTTIATIDSATGTATGTGGGIATITYTAGGCFATANLTVNVSPDTITGPTVVCQYDSITLADAVPGDTWSSSDNAVATVGATTGIVTGVTAGVVTITYADPVSSCFVTYTVTVNLAPTAIVGSPLICTGSTVNYTDAVAGGTWTSSNTAVATIDSTLGVATGVAVGAATITYTITDGGCFVTLDVTDNDPPVGIAGPTVVCQNSTITLTDATAGGVWRSANTIIATVDSTTGDVTGVTAGTVAITYINTTSTCFVTYTITVNPIPSPIVGDTFLCTGNSVTYTDADPGGTWSSSATGVATVDSLSGVVTGIAVGSVTISYTFSITGCFVTINATDNDPPTAIGGPTVVCQNSTITLTDGTAGDKWVSGNTAIATVDSVTGDVTGIAAGTVTITYLNPGTTCFVTYDITVNPIPSPILGPIQVCTGNTANYTDADAGGTWSSSATAVATIDSVTGELIGVAAGTATISYTFTITGCATTLDITDNDPPVAIVEADSLVCTGYTTALTDATPDGFWTSSAPGIASVDALTGLVYGISAGTAIITYLVPGTTCFDTALITDVDPPTPISGFTNQVCEGGTIVLSESVSGGIWTSTSTTTATVDSFGLVTIVSGVLAGLDTIKYTITGCPSADFPITVNPTPQPIVGADSVCEASVTTLTDPTGGGTWTSSDNSIATVDPSTGDVFGVSAGFITITYTLPAGCFVTFPFTVNPLPATIGTTTIFVVCEGSSITLTDVTPLGKWSSGNTGIATVDSLSGLVTGVAGGIVDITFTLPTSCYVTKTITVNPLPSSITGPSVVCVDAIIALADATPDGTWSSGDNTIATVDYTTGVVKGVTAGVVNITYAIPTGCIASVSITVNPIPAAIFGLSQVCVGSNISLTDATAGGVWSTSDASIATVDITGILYGANAGVVVDTYKLITTGCFVTTAVTVNPLPSPIGGTLSVCQTGTVTLTDADAGGTWTSSNIARATIDTFTGVVTGILPGGVNIIYTLPTGCSISALLTVLASPSAALTNSGPTTFCAGGNVLISAPVGLGYTYQWFDSGLAVPGATFSTFSAVTDGIYSVEVTNANGCTTTSLPDTVHAEVSPLLVYTGSSTFCYGNTIMLGETTGGAVGVFTYQWLRNGLIIPGAVSATYTANSSGIYRVVVNTSGASGVCTDTSDQLTITVNPIPSATIIYDGTTLVTPDVFTGYQWFMNMVGIPGATSNTYVPLIDASYRVLVIDANGCDAYSNAIAINLLGVGQLTKTDINIYPNPATNVLHIESPVEVRAVITGIEGKKLLEQENAKDVDLESLPGGLYIIMLYDENGEMLLTQKLVKE